MSNEDKGIVFGLACAFIVMSALAGIGSAVASDRHHRTATWVSEAHDYGVSKSGRIWRQEEFTAAMKGTSELGKWKRVALAEAPDRPIYVLVTDRLPDKARSDIDLSKGATLLLGGDDLIRRGRFSVIVEDAP